MSTLRGREYTMAPTDDERFPTPSRPGNDIRGNHTRGNSEDMGHEKTSFCVVKYIFFTFNIFMWLLGCAVLSVSIWVWASRGTSLSVVPTYSFLSSSSLGIIAAVLVLAIGFLGCCGAFYENQCLLIGYFVLVLLVFALEVTAGTLGFVYKGRVRDIVRSELAGGIRYDYQTQVQIENMEHNSTSYDHDAEGWSTSLDSLQKDLECCGADNYTDWYDANAWPGQKQVPESCCIHPKRGCGKKGDPNLWHSRGCVEEMDYWLTKNMYVMGVTGVTVASVQILAMVAAVAQFCYIRSKRFPL